MELNKCNILKMKIEGPVSIHYSKSALHKKVPVTYLRILHIQYTIISAENALGGRKQINPIEWAKM